MDPNAPQPTEGDWASRVKETWETLARSEKRDFFVASHPGWDDPARWLEQARSDVENFLLYFERERLTGGQVLEIGCGVGRLASPLSAMAAGYTGIDVAEGMVDEARRRCADVANARFFASDGAEIPAPACDRRYALIVALAVFIHCPRALIESLVASAYPLLDPGGQLRFQFNCDPTDPEGIVPHPGSGEELAAAQDAEREEQEREFVAFDDETRELLRDRPYQGHVFRYAEVEPFLRAAVPGRVQVFRFDPSHVYGWIEHP